MTDWTESIIQNAQKGLGPCAGCPAHDATEGWCVNPGLSNPNAEILFVTEEPSHTVDWNRFESWAAYNEEYTQKFRGWRGGRFIQQHYLSPFGLTMDDAWIADSLKCRPEDKRGKGLFNKSGAASHCQTYLEDELAAVDPKVIVTLGAAATKRTLRALGVPEDQASQVKISTDFGRCEFETEWPVIMTLHWAQRTVKQATFLPVVKRALKNALDESNDTTTTTDLDIQDDYSTNAPIDTPIDTVSTSPDTSGRRPRNTAPSETSGQKEPLPVGKNVFLVPFDSANFNRTMDGENPVNLSNYDGQPTPLSDLNEARFWGTRVGSRNRSVFEQMQPGDLLLFYHDKTYVRMGLVGRTFEDHDGWASSTFWGGAPAGLIYTVEEYESINVPRPAMNVIFGYKRAYYPQGITRVADSKMRHSVPTIRRAISMYSDKNR